MILTEDDADVVVTPQGEADHIQGDANVDSLFLAGSQDNLTWNASSIGEQQGRRPVHRSSIAKSQTGVIPGEGDSSTSKPQVTSEDVHAGVSTQEPLLGCPEIVPVWIVVELGYARVKANLPAFPSPTFADSVGQGERMIIRIVVVERLDDRMKEVLAVDERHHSFGWSWRNMRR
ncbi:hypothetical protein [Paludisphaera rhizosphaerae]|uniref:hypothetical protein n=1 Tax=Paludisphaera rhizosphaerae TaxID=2711216 RepID=UPI001F0D86AE|nr:hypothetical protein [Paludisphaera rhizosphaerae]